MDRPPSRWLFFLPFGSLALAQSQAPSPGDLFLLVLLLAFSAFFSASETAFTTLYPWKVRELAEKAVEVAELGLKATEIRLKGGGATSLDLLEAQNRLLEARKNLELAQRGRDTALAALANLVGDWKPEGVKELPALPEEKLVETLLQEHTDLLQLKQSLALLRFQRGLLDESFVPRKEIEALEDQIQTLEANLANLERSLRVGLEARYRQLSPLLQGVKTAEEAYRAAQERYRAEEKRFQAGLTSRLGLLQQELALKQAALSLEQAKHAYLKAYYGLLASR